MTDAFTDALEARVAEIETIEDPVQRGLVAREAREHLAASDRKLYAIQQAAVQALRPGRTWAEVGDLFGRSYAWAEAIAKGRSSKRGKDHAAESMPRAGAEEGHRPDSNETGQ